MKFVGEYTVSKLLGTSLVENAPSLNQEGEKNSRNIKINFQTWLVRRLSLEKLPRTLQARSLDFFFLASLMTFAFSVTGTFLILFLLDVITWQQLGILLAIQMIVQVIFDYPTGALGDSIGHRKVLIGAYVGYIISTILLIFANSFPLFLAYGIISALANSQQSGTLDAWFDNHYRKVSKDCDSDRKIYGQFMGKIQSVNMALAGSSFLIGGAIATIWSRRMLFTIQLVLLIMILGLIVCRIKPVDDNKHVNVNRSTYFQVFSSGIKFFTSNRSVFLIFAGIALAGGVSYAIWGNMVLFPLYSSYGGSDSLTGLLRGTIFGILVLFHIGAAMISSRITKTRLWLFISAICSNSVFFTSAAIYYHLVPPEHTFVFWKFIGIILVFSSFGIWIGLTNILYTRVQLDLIPDNIRNSIYSLLPTLVLIIGIPFTIIGSIIISNFGMLAGMILVIIFSILGISFQGVGLLSLPHHQPSSIVSENV